MTEYIAIGSVAVRGETLEEAVDLATHDPEIDWNIRHIVTEESWNKIEPSRPWLRYLLIAPAAIGVWEVIEYAGDLLLT